MKICAIICEFNPFHNGHKYLIERAREISGCDYVLCLMSGCFTQRGDICVLDKSKRAAHAILCGADIVLELPVSFAVAPAEIFAKGAVKILSAIPDIDCLAFGCENEDADFIETAKLLVKENRKFKDVFRQNIENGESYIKSYSAAFKACNGQSGLLSSPNNILGVEYAKAVIGTDRNIKLLPIKRIGGGYSESSLHGEFSSAKSIRENICDPHVEQSIPACVFKDLKDISAQIGLFKEYLRFALATSDGSILKRIYGCNEGLEYSLLKNSHMKYDDIIEAVSGKRYTRSRIKRILLANMLKLYKDNAETYLSAEKLYLKPLALKDEPKDALLSAMSKSASPLILKVKQTSALSGAAEKCFKSDYLASDVYNLIFDRPKIEFDYPIFI